jgi:hypothetical protein
LELLQFPERLCTDRIVCRNHDLIPLVSGGLMTDILAPIITILVIGLFVGSWVFYLRRVRQGRADAVVDPGLPSNLQGLSGGLHDTSGGHSSTSSLYLDPDEYEPRRGPE